LNKEEVQSDAKAEITLPATKKFVSFKKQLFMATKRTTHRSTSGKKLYAVRDEKGRFVDIQTYQKAHSADLRKQHTKNDKTSK
jgi:hypothetical protein